MKSTNYISALKKLYREYIAEKKTQVPFEVVGVEQNGSSTHVVIRLEGHLIIRKTPEEVILDDCLVDGLQPRAVRAITYLAVLQKLSPEYSLISWELDRS